MRNVSKGKIFQCEITVSSGVEEKLFKKHGIEIWEVEEAIYDDPFAFAITYQNCYFVYGQTFSGRYLLVLIRVLSVAEVTEMGFPHDSNVIKIITAREMNPKQRRLYLKRKGI